jgi:hypothetical protein
MSTIGIILLVIAAISVGFIYYAIKTAERHDEKLEESINKFQARKMTDLSKGTIGGDPVEKPKRKKKRYYNKKKPSVANNAPVEKRPVGRPKKSN